MIYTSKDIQYITTDKIVVAKFVSVNNTINGTNELNDGYRSATIAKNPMGIWEEMARVATLNTQPLPPFDPRNKLRLLNDINDFVRFRKVLIKSIYFTNYFVKSKGNANLGITGDQVNEVIKNSLQTINQGYPQAMFDRSAVVSFQPNFFNPIVIVNGKEIYANTNNTINEQSGGYASSQDHSIGIELPHTADLNIVIERINNIEVYACCYNIVKIEDNYYYQRYPIKAEMQLLVLEE